MTTVAKRLAASPYARRLAYERSLPLDALRGSGPGGRILAADVRAFVLPSPATRPPRADVPAASPTQAIVPTAAFAATLDLAALKKLLADLERTGHVFAIDDLLLCAAGRAFAPVQAGPPASGAVVALELTGRQVVFDLSAWSPASVRATRLAALEATQDDAPTMAMLSLLVFEDEGVRPVTMPLQPGSAMRLAIAIYDSGAECLLTTDVAEVDEAAAASWLARLKAEIENPLRLFV